MEIIRSSLACLLLCSFAAAAEAPPISDAQAAKIFEGVEKAGEEVVPCYELALKLGVPTDKMDPCQIHFLSRRFTGEDGVEHTFGRSKEIGDYVVVVQTKSLISYIHADKKFKFVGGAYYHYKVAEPAQTITPEEAARALLEHELSLWVGRLPTH